MNKYSGLYRLPIEDEAGTTVKDLTRTSSKRKMALTSRVVLSALLLSSSLLLSHPFSVFGTATAPGSSPSWNPAVSCTALLTTIETVIGNHANANGGGNNSGGRLPPGIPLHRAHSPPCPCRWKTQFL